MKLHMRSPDVRALIRQIPAEARDIPEIVIAHLRPHACMVALWRRDDALPQRWVYLERIWAEAFSVDEVIQRYGGGEYRAKILGQWDPSQRREQYLTQITFGIDRHCQPTAATLAKMRSR
ncbi:MAG: hypothetical protein AUH42_00240 [Gemmatimonadetes bacterium 13_1_40CM_70_11]|nr:MAG: hypothetical protein AUH42_00240 [Gemmatimonadetes bacterium 13_1_40CM_70_11]